MAHLKGRGSALMVAVSLSALAGCAGPGAVPAGLHGTWEWAGTSGGIAGDSRTPGPDDPRITLEIRSDGTAVFRQNGEVARTQRYRVVSEPSIYHGTDMPVLYYDDEQLGRVVEVLDGGRTLTLSDNVYDGFSLAYRRVERARTPNSVRSFR